MRYDNLERRCSASRLSVFWTVASRKDWIRQENPYAASRIGIGSMISSAAFDFSLSLRDPVAIFTAVLPVLMAAPVVRDEGRREVVRLASGYLGRCSDNHDAFSD